MMLHNSLHVVIVLLFALPEKWVCTATKWTRETVPYQDIFRSLPMAAVVIRPDMVILDANEKYFEITLLTPSIIGKTVNDMGQDMIGTDEASLQVMEDAFRHVLSEKTKQSYDFLDLSKRVWHVDILPILIPAQSQSLALMQCHVTEHTYLYNEQRLDVDILHQLQDVDNYRRLVDAVRTYGIFMVDDAGIVRHWNHGAATVTKWSEEEAVGRNIYTFYSALDHENIHKQLQEQSVEKSSHLLQETTFLKKDGTSFPADTTITPIYYNNRDHIGHAFVVRDLTHEIAAQKELKNAYEQAAKLKDEFTSRCSHDIRTPLNSISLAADALFATTMTPEQTELVYLMKRAVKKQLVHVNEILDFSKLTVPGRRLSLHLEPTDLIQFLQVELDDFKLIAPSDVDVIFEHSDQSYCYMVDQSKLQQITSNLISNALKFTTKGTVSLILTVGESLDQTADLLTFTFKDTGQGVSSEAIKTLFVPYTQIDGSNTQRNRGSGLGLSIVKIVVQGMGGTVEMTSDGIGKGCQVVVRLPLIRSTARPKFARSQTSTTIDGVATTATGGGLQQLIIAEDDDINRSLLVRGLKRLGYLNVTEAKNGQELVNLAMPGHNFKLIITDIQMPFLSGIEAAKQIRLYDQITPIIALTADGTEPAMRACKDAGMTSVMVKPTRVKVLGKVIVDLLS